MNVPTLTGFNFKGGLSISPEFTALLLGLVLYTSAFVAEVVRAGIQSVGKGQKEAEGDGRTDLRRQAMRNSSEVRRASREEAPEELIFL